MVANGQAHGLEHQRLDCLLFKGQLAEPHRVGRTGTGTARDTSGERLPRFLCSFQNWADLSPYPPGFVG